MTSVTRRRYIYTSMSLSRITSHTVSHHESCLDSLSEFRVSRRNIRTRNDPTNNVSKAHRASVKVCDRRVVIQPFVLAKDTSLSRVVSMKRLTWTMRACAEECC